MEVCILIARVATLLPTVLQADSISHISTPVLPYSKLSNPKSDDDIFLLSLKILIKLKYIEMPQENTELLQADPDKWAGLIV